MCFLFSNNLSWSVSSELSIFSSCADVASPSVWCSDLRSRHGTAGIRCWNDQTTISRMSTTTVLLATLPFRLARRIPALAWACDLSLTYASHRLRSWDIKVCQMLCRLWVPVLTWSTSMIHQMLTAAAWDNYLSLLLIEVSGPFASTTLMLRRFGLLISDLCEWTLAPQSVLCRCWTWLLTPSP